MFEQGQCLEYLGYVTLPNISKCQLFARANLSICTLTLRCFVISPLHLNEWLGSSGSKAVQGSASILSSTGPT